MLRFPTALPGPRVRSLCVRDAYGSSDHNSVVLLAFPLWGHHMRCRLFTGLHGLRVEWMLVRLLGHIAGCVVGKAHPTIELYLPL